MAKNRYGKKKGKKVARKSSKRSAAAKKAWRTKVRRYGREKAIAMSFGGSRKRGGKRTGSRKRSKVATRSRRGGRASFASVLAEVKRNEGTSAYPVSASERRKAEQVFQVVHAAGPKRPSGEESRRAAYEAKIAREKKQEAARRYAYRVRVAEEQKREEARKRAQAEAAAEVEREYSAL